MDLMDEMDVMGRTPSNKHDHVHEHEKRPAWILLRRCYGGLEPGATKMRSKSWRRGLCGSLIAGFWVDPGFVDDLFDVIVGVWFPT